MSEEIWKDIEGHPYYQCSSLGNFRALARPGWHNHSKGYITLKPKSLKLVMDSNGYHQVRLKYTGVLSHRIIAITFIPNPENKPQVNHKNGIKTDNRVENLEWATRSENCKHSFSIGLQCNKGENHPRHKVTYEMAKEIRAKFKPRKYSSRKLATEYGLSKTNVLDIIHRKIWNYDNC